MSTIGQNIPRNELLQRARDLQNSVSSDSAFPYQRSMKEVSDSFISSLENAPDGTLTQIKTHALEVAAAQSKKANICTMGGFGVLLAGSMLPLPGGQIVKYAVIGGGFFASSILGTRAKGVAQEQQQFAAQLGEWQRSIDAEAAKGAQPEVTPSQAAAAVAQMQV